MRHYRWWYGALVCLAVVGCAALPGRGAAFLVLLTAGYAASVVLFFVAERYRLPLVPLLAPASAAGALELARAVRGRAWRRLAALAALGGAAALVVFPDWFDAGRERISADFQMGQVHLMRGEPDWALAYLNRARAADPGILTCSTRWGRPTSGTATCRPPRTRTTRRSRSASSVRSGSTLAWSPSGGAAHRAARRSATAGRSRSTPARPRARQSRGARGGGGRRAGPPE